MKITAYVMTKDESEVIGACLQSLDWCDEVIVADTGSSDNTVNIARNHQATVKEFAFEGFGPTRNKIIDSIESDWILCFDADEICTEELKTEIQKVLKNPKAVAYQAPRRNYLLGKEIKHSGWCPDFRHPVLFKKGCMKYDNASIHEGFLADGRVEKLTAPFDHYSFRRLEQMMTKERSYAMQGISNVLAKTSTPSYSSGLTHGIWAFCRHYIVKKGFLDGWAGFIIAMSSAHSTFFRYAMATEKVSQKTESTKE